MTLLLALACTDKGSLELIDSGDTDAVSCEEVLVAWSFDEGDEGWDSDETDDGFDDPWDYGETDCHSGDACWSTGLDGEYGDCEAGALVSPVIDLSPCAERAGEVELAFFHTYQMEDMSSDTWWDGATVQVSGDGGETWDDVDPSEAYTGTITGNFSECEDDSSYDGQQGWSGIGDGWDEVTIELEPEALTSQFQVRFWFVSDRAATEAGWTIDDVEVRL